MTEISPDELNSKRKGFTCGVVEGFYGRPWTTEQRKDLFKKLKKWGMEMYVYAPKDDYKHRAYWRELYTVEEAEHLTSLIAAARAQGITFCYALSPGLDITYSSQKEITAMKRKLEQVSQFGCTCFALLFDDIEPEMSEADKQTFQSFAHAQVSVTNEIHQHLGCPRFLLCPTQYCSTRAVPSVNNSEYLNTIGTKLSLDIDVMWTGPKVISKILTTECIEEITRVLRRPPVIWDNLHANDYDQKRIFLGPYCGRSPELIPLLRGVLTNPNCEYNANLVAIWTLAHWAHCSLAAPTHMEAVSWDIKLERESEQGLCEDEAPLALGNNVYHYRRALRQAIDEWLPEFSIPKTAQGPIIKPQPPVTVPPVPIVPILPSVNTCMSLVTATSNTSTTSTADMVAIPTVNTSQLQALADVCSAANDRPIISTGVAISPSFNPVSNPVMNSLVSPTKVILNEAIQNPIIPMASSNISLPSEIPISTLPVPILGLKTIDQGSGEKTEDQQMEKVLDGDVVVNSGGFVDDMSKRNEDADTIIVDEIDKVDEQQRNGEMSVGVTPQTLSPSRPPPPEADLGVEPLDVDPPSTAATDTDVIMNDGISENGSMQVEPSHSPLSTDMMVESTEATDATDEPVEEPAVDVDANALTTDDLVLLCDLFYLPFEHGARGLRIMHDFNWLVLHASSTLARGNKPETSEWVRRRQRFSWWAAGVRRLARRLHGAPNRELRAELAPYVWDLCHVLALLHAFVRWLELGKFPSNIAANIQGNYNWFSKGWREAFESGAQEPWVFRGGLSADLRRLLPVECGGDALRAALPPPAPLPLAARPYRAADEPQVCALCHRTYRDGSDCSELFPGELHSLPSDRLVQPFLTLYPELCMVLEDDEGCQQPERESLAGEGDVEGEDRLDSLPGPRINAGAGAGAGAVVGYACAAPSFAELQQRRCAAWAPEMCRKYPAHLLHRPDVSDAAKECIREFHASPGAAQGGAQSPAGGAHPAVLQCRVAPAAAERDPLAPARLLTCLLAALRANGVTGVHVAVSSTDVGLQQFYSKLGFAEAAREGSTLYMARTF